MHYYFLLVFEDIVFFNESILKLIPSIPAVKQSNCAVYHRIEASITPAGGMNIAAKPITTDAVNAATLNQGLILSIIYLSWLLFYYYFNM